MKLLITNDDGILAPGIRALCGTLSARHDVTVCAPRTEQSGMSHSLTYRMPIRVFPFEMEGLSKVAAYAVEGTPVDCVKFALTTLKTKFDMVVSGINNGANIGTDVFYSATLGAAMEGAANLTPSLAVSVAAFDAKHFNTAAALALEYIDILRDSGCMLMNLNVPDLPRDEIKGIKNTAIGRHDYSSSYIAYSDPHGRDYYWIPAALPVDRGDEDTDLRWIAEGYATVTPMLTNFTDRAALERMK